MTEAEKRMKEAVDVLLKASQAMWDGCMFDGKELQGKRKQMTHEEVVAEYDPHWDCPKCKEMTSMADETVDWFVAGGEYADVVCSHGYDEGGDDLVPCSAKYRVKL